MKNLLRFLFCTLLITPFMAHGQTCTMFDDNYNVVEYECGTTKIQNMDAVDKNGNTALCNAILMDDIKTYQTLRAQGADINHKCTTKIPTEQYDAFMQKLIESTKPWSFLGLGKWAWGAIGLGTVGAVVAMSSGGSSGGSGNNNDDYSCIKLGFTQQECPEENDYVSQPCYDNAGVWYRCERITVDTPNTNENQNPSCQSQGYEYQYSDSCPDGWVKNNNDYCNNNDGTGVWFKCNIPASCPSTYYTECQNGYEEVPGDICLSGTNVYKRCVEASCIGFDKYEFSTCDVGWLKGSSCLSGTTMKYKCDLPVNCAGYVPSCANGYIATNDTCKHGNDTYVSCVLDSENYIEQDGIAYQKLNCQNGGTQTGATCTCQEGWTGTLCDIPVSCGPAYTNTYCTIGYLLTSSCISGGITYVECILDSENYIEQDGVAYQKLNCQNGGTQTGATCTCQEGWTGTLCDTPYSCDSNYVSACLSGYDETGRTCRSGDNILVECEPTQCGVNAHWEGTACVCDNGYGNYMYGVGCSLIPLDCDHGTQSGTQCSCDNGWIGNLCDTLDSENYIEQDGVAYQKLNCQNGGTQTGATCTCQEGWTSTLCDIPVQCDYQTTSCTGGYEPSGLTCKSGNDIYIKCEPIECGVNATWTESGCICNEGYRNWMSSVGCELIPLHCGKNAHQEGTQCVCDTGAMNWNGIECSLMVQNCGAHAYQNGTQCQCESGYENFIDGVGCSLTILDCGSNAHQVGTQCQCEPSYINWTNGIGCYAQLNCGAHAYQNENACECEPGYDNWVSGVGCSVSLAQNTIVINNNDQGNIYGKNTDTDASNNYQIINIYNTNNDSDIYGIKSQGTITNGGVVIVNNSGDGDVYGLSGRNCIYNVGNGIYNAHNHTSTGKIQIINMGNGNIYGITGGGSIINNVFVSGYDDASYGYIDIQSQGEGNIFGIKADGNVSIVSNTYTTIPNNILPETHGIIKISYSGSGNAYGMYLYGYNSSYTPHMANGLGGTGIIEISNKGSGNIYGMYAYNTRNGASVSNGENITYNNYINLGTGYINLINYSIGNAYGLYSNTNHALLKNESSNSYINMQNLSSGTAVGLYTNGGIATNSGTININNTGSGTAIGIFGDTNSAITNSGVINITRDSYVDEDNILHEPTGMSGDVFGIYAKSGSTINNSGNITIKTNGDAYGIYVEGNSNVTNTGTITINGVGCDKSTCYGNYENYIVLNGSTLYNSGVVQANALNLNSMGGNVVAGTNSQFIVENELSGDLNISSDIVQDGNQTQYTAHNMIDAGDISALNVRSASAMFDASIADNGHDVVMTMRDFGELTDNSSLAAFLAHNYANGNGTELFSTLKSMDNMTAFDGALSGLTGLNTFTQFAHEDLSAMREISFSMNNKLFENSNRDSFDISDSMGYFSFSNDRNGGSGQYGITSDRVSENWKLGYGMAMANINTNDGDGVSRQNKMWLFYMPATYENDGYELVIAPKAGFAHSEYSRRGYNNINYEGYIEKRIFGLMNDLRYPLSFGNWTIAPDFAFNTIVYTQSGHEEEQAFSLVIPDDRTVSIETGFGLYGKYEKTLLNGGLLKFTSGIMGYREFGDSYDIKLGMRGMDGTFNLYNNDYEYRGAASLGFDYTSGRLHLYGNAQYFMDNDNYINFKSGVSYRF